MKKKSSIILKEEIAQINVNSQYQSAIYSNPNFAVSLGYRSVYKPAVSSSESRGIPIAPHGVSIDYILVNGEMRGTYLTPLSSSRSIYTQSGMILRMKSGIFEDPYEYIYKDFEYTMQELEVPYMGAKIGDCMTWDLESDFTAFDMIFNGCPSYVKKYHKNIGRYILTPENINEPAKLEYILDYPTGMMVINVNCEGLPSNVTLPPLRIVLNDEEISDSFYTNDNKLISFSYGVCQNFDPKTSSTILNLPEGIYVKSIDINGGSSLLTLKSWSSNIDGVTSSSNNPYTITVEIEYGH